MRRKGNKNDERQEWIRLDDLQLISMYRRRTCQYLLQKKVFKRDEKWLKFIWRYLHFGDVCASLMSRCLSLNMDTRMFSIAWNRHNLRRAHTDRKTQQENDTHAPNWKIMKFEQYISFREIQEKILSYRRNHCIADIINGLMCGMFKFYVCLIFTVRGRFHAIFSCYLRSLL